MSGLCLRFTSVLQSTIFVLFFVSGMASAGRDGPQVRCVFCPGGNENCADECLGSACIHATLVAERPLTRRYCAKWREPELPPAGHCEIFRSSFGSEQICLCTRDLCNGQNIAIGASTFDSPVIQTQLVQTENRNTALFNFHAALTQAFRQKFEEELRKHGH